MYAGWHLKCVLVIIYQCTTSMKLNRVSVLARWSIGGPTEDPRRYLRAFDARIAITVAASKSVRRLSAEDSSTLSWLQLKGPGKMSHSKRVTLTGGKQVGKMGETGVQPIHH